PSPPTSILPPLARLASYTSDQISSAITNLRTLYFPSPPQISTIHKRLQLPRTLTYGDDAPDSGYASAEEDEEACRDSDEEDALDVLRGDAFERSFALKWLTGFVARADAWLTGTADERDTVSRTAALDAASALLSRFVGSAPEPAVTRAFAFATPGSGAAIEVQLNDAPLLDGDHTCVGLQSWASSIVLAERMCADPPAFGLERPTRVLELGAGTGLLSIAAAQLLFPASTPIPPTPSIIATDYHPAVLTNLARNVAANGVAARVAVRALDWAAPDFPPGGRFAVVLAADVVYAPAHAAWLARCVAGLLARPGEDGKAEGGVFWMIIALRGTGRHEGLADTVGTAFPRTEEIDGIEWTLGILGVDTLGKVEGVGRADEGGYRLYKIGWV
ncbi:hypothetical protein FA95DRAFT_1452067, partial [Auriscalpium vulgare]